MLNMLHPEKFSSLDSFEGKFQSMDQKDQLSQLHAMLQPHILRRAKNEVEAAIPPKMEFILRVELSPLQKTYYKVRARSTRHPCLAGADESFVTN